MTNFHSKDTNSFSSNKLFDALHEHLAKSEPPILRLVAGPQDINIDGIIFGGWLMAQVDIAASILAKFTAKGRVVTKAINSFSFEKIINVGDLLSFYGHIINIGTTSLTININVYSQNQKNFEIVTHIAKASLTFVAVDKKGTKRKVPDWLQKN